MTFSLQDWHTRFIQQASWTAEVRTYLLGKLDLLPNDRVLEVGCGTGVITRELAQDVQSITYGVDIDHERLVFARNFDQASRYSCADGLYLPFPDNSFSLVCCHYFLLWIKDQPSAVGEMMRITKKDGSIILFAEPDHASRIDYPELFIHYGKLQTDALGKQGIDPFTGRKIGWLLTSSGLKDVETGLLHWQQEKMDLSSTQAEWNVAVEDLRINLSRDQIKKVLELEKKHWKDSSRVRIIPTFYAIGKVKK